MTVPRYWMDEVSGELAPAVHRFLKGEPLTVTDVAMLQAYLWQWISAAVWRGGSTAARRWTGGPRTPSRSGSTPGRR